MKSFLYPCVFCLLLASIFFGMLISCTKQTITVHLLDSSDLPNQIHIPVTINDRVLRFLFDTGSNITLIDSALANKIGLDIDGNLFVTIPKIDGTVHQDSIGYAKVRYSIGNSNLKSGLMYFFAQNKAYLDNELLINIGAVLGMDIIHQNNWLFNFTNKTATFSKDKIDIPVLPDDKILILDFYPKPGSGIANMDITIDGQSFQNVLFDTGCEKTLIFSDIKQSIDIIFSEQDYIAYASKLKFSSIGIDIYGQRFILSDSIQINDCTMQGVFAYENKEHVRTMITANFVRRFRMMYIDSKNKKIQLYVSPSDSARYQRKDIPDFIREMSPHIQGNDTINVDLSKINL